MVLSSNYYYDLTMLFMRCTPLVYSEDWQTI